MSYTLTFSMALGSEFAATTFVAYFVNTAGTTVSDPCYDGFVYVGGDYFMWTCAEIPTNFRGGVKIFDQADLANLLIFFAINPEEAEYAAGLSGSTSVFIGHSQNSFDVTESPSSASSNISVTTGVR